MIDGIGKLSVIELAFLAALSLFYFLFKITGSAEY
jgi:hypothetical protein